MPFSWVNHKQTRDHEVRGGYLWSPIRNANGAFNQTYENMRLVRPGDIVFSYANGQIGSIGQVVDAAAASPKPSEFGNVGDYWADEGWLVSVYFSDAPKSLRPKAHIENIAPFLPTKYSPIQKNGDGNQGCYLAGISDALGHILLSMLGVEAPPDFTPTLFVAEPNADVLEDLHLIERDANIPATQRLQLTKARVGQGLFRNRVMSVDPRCRVTGIEDPRLLIASHIKPWRDSTNAERINGFNGLMLSPHIDALFDERLISFEDDGRMLVHPSLSNDVLDRWSISKSTKVGGFLSEQSSFLTHHRNAFLVKLT
ncbi:HNH endonuclease [Marilutibacter aestuarii]|uniref:HNH endonuclease n=1 Tax=Marilutibacter aestuarii TaxID=1706195 RepID=A0A508A5R2_9GAMM|nr:HNH endonuclease signature motif containing protein [Lysobacter aestuarii]TQD45286.1 HNH endonuclease [Lysobacter aestuarii]